MPDKSYDILINIEARAQAIQEAVTQVQRLQQEASGIEKAFEFGGAIELTHRLAEALQEIPNVLLESVKTGVEFTSELQNVTNSIAGIFRQNAGAKFIDFSSARQEAQTTVDLLRKKANELGIDYRAFFESYTTSVNALFAGGITNVQKQIDVTATLTRTMAALGIQGFQAARDTADILNGLASRTIAGKSIAASLGLTTEDFDKQLQAAKQTGQLYQYLTTSLSGFQEAGAAAARSFSADLQRLKNETIDLQQTLAQPIVQPLQTAIADLNASLQGEGIKAVATTLGQDIAADVIAFEALAKATAVSAEFLSKWTGVAFAVNDALSALGGGSAGAAFLFGQASSVASNVDSQRTAALFQDVNALLDQAKAAKTVQDADAARAAIQERIFQLDEQIGQGYYANGQYALQQRGILQQILTEFDSYKASADDVTRSLREQNEELEKFLKHLPEVISKLQEMASALTKAQDFSGLNKAQQLARTVTDQAKTLADFNNLLSRASAAPVTAATSAQQAVAALKTLSDARSGNPAAVVDEISLQNAEKAADKLLSISQDRVTLEREATAESNKQLIAADRRALTDAKAAHDTSGVTAAQLTLDIDDKIQQAKERGETLSRDAAKAEVERDRAAKEYDKDVRSAGDAHREITNLLREDSALLKNLRAQQSLIEQNPDLSADQKQGALHVNAIAQQAAVALATKNTEEELRKAYGSGSQQDIVQLGEKLDRLKVQTVELGFTVSKTSFTGALRDDLTQFANSFGTTSHQISNALTTTIGTAVGGLSNALTGLIFKTETWEQAFDQAAESIVANLINIVLQWGAQQLVLLALNAIFGRTAESTSSKLAASAAISWAPAAVSASIATEGAAAGFGTVAYIAGLAAGTGAAAAFSAGGGFESGGYTGFGDPSGVAGLVHNDEVVFESPVVQNLGLHNLLQIRAMGQSGGSFASGGYTSGSVSSSGSGSLVKGGPVQIIMVQDMKQAIKEYNNSSEFDKRIVEVVNRRGGTLRT